MEHTSMAHAPGVVLIFMLPKGAVGAIVMLVEQLALVTWGDRDNDLVCDDSPGIRPLQWNPTGTRSATQDTQRQLCCLVLLQQYPWVTLLHQSSTDCWRVPVSLPLVLTKVTIGQTYLLHPPHI